MIVSSTLVCMLVDISAMQDFLVKVNSPSFGLMKVNARNGTGRFLDTSKKAQKVPEVLSTLYKRHPKILQSDSV